jgi:hypothetical protein
MSSQNNHSYPSSVTIDHGSIRIYYNIFCTTATPHLGISRHTWLKIPRLAEVSIAHLLGETGKDLVRFFDNNFIQSAIQQ